MQIIHTDDAPQAVGTYSQATKVGNTVYISGQIPFDPKTMQVVRGDFEARVSQVLQNLAAIAKASGGDLTKIVKINVFLTDLSNFEIVNAIFERELSAPFPARALVEVSALPKGVDVEMEAILYLG